MSQLYIHMYMLSTWDLILGVLEPGTWEHETRDLETGTWDLGLGTWDLRHDASHNTPQTTSHITPHTSHLTPNTSHITPHTSHLTPHTSVRPRAHQVDPTCSDVLVLKIKLVCCQYSYACPKDQRSNILGNVEHRSNEFQCT